MNKKIKEQYKEEFLSLLNEWEFGKGSISISESPTFLGEIHIHIVFSFNYDKNILTQIEKKYFDQTDKYLQGQHLFTTGIDSSAMAIGTFRITEKEFEDLYDLVYSVLEELHISHQKPN